MKRSPLLVIFLTIFIDLVGVGILIPVVPQLLAKPDSPEYLLPIGMSLSQGYMLLGALTASYPIMQFFASPILGQMSDRFGRRPVLVASLAGTCVGYVLFALAIITHNIPLLFASRMLDGITGGNISVAQAVIADVSTPQNRAKNFGLIGAAFGLGFIMGPYLGGQLANTAYGPWFNAATPFWFAAFLAFINICSILLLLPETNTRRTTGRIDWEKSIHNVIRAFHMKERRWLFIVNFVYISGFSFFTTLFGVFLIARFSFNEAGIGNLFAYIGLWVVITQGFLTRIVSKRWTEKQIVSVSLVGTGVGLLLFLLPGPWTFMLATNPVFAICNGLTQSNVMALISRSAADTVQGEILGINASVAALAQALPPIASGVIAATLTPSVTMIVAALIVISSGIIFLLTVRRQPVLVQS